MVGDVTGNTGKGRTVAVFVVNERDQPMPAQNMPDGSKDHFELEASEKQ